ncbi:DEKNAAC101768 [Brettanomyces naardenensis]|uniref:DEKNAAC101768 n=1 Tax=Brettanomyces naardenensis TaxID=13370 RepID=A0A448YIX0_BRENA|nr:DEKNAAC101768 [Brettanomyces naardenensis]
MGIVKDLQGFFHNLTTDDHYASYEDYAGEAKESSAPGTGPFSQSTISMINNRSSSSLHSQPQDGSVPGSSSSGRPVQYNPGMRSQLAAGNQGRGGAGGIPMQEYVNGRAPLPSIAEIWDRIDNWLEREFPELGDDMEDGATANDLNAFEKDLNISLPLDVRDSFKIHDGQVSLGKTRGLIYGYPLLDLESIAGETNIWRKVYATLEKKSDLFLNSNESSASFQQQRSTHSKFLANQRSIPDGAIQELYCHPNWIPIVKDNAGNNIAIDLAAGPKGHWGQIILFGRDYDTKVVVASSLTEFLFNLCEDLEDGKFDIDEDEELTYYDHNTPYEYYRVLKMRALARYKSDVQRPQQEDAKSRQVAPASEKQAPLQVPKVEIEQQILLPKETLISPIPESKAVYEDKTVKNDSFVIDEDEVVKEPSEASEGKLLTEKVVSLNEVNTPEEKLVEPEQQEVSEDSAERGATKSENADNDQKTKATEEGKAQNDDSEVSNAGEEVEVKQNEQDAAGPRETTEKSADEPVQQNDSEVDDAVNVAVPA